MQRIGTLLALPAAALAYGVGTRAPAHTAPASSNAPSLPFSVAGVDVIGAGVVPYARSAGRTYFLLQQMQNGTREGLLCDFGGRREPYDADAFFTAARELSEETDFAFGDVQVLAARLRQKATAQILHPTGRYLTFFLPIEGGIDLRRVARRISASVDHADDDAPAARVCRWYAADELIGHAEKGAVLGRLVAGPRHAGSALGSSRLHAAIIKTAARASPPRRPPDRYAP